VDIQINIDEKNIHDIPLLCKVINEKWSVSHTSIILNPVLHATNPQDNIKILEMYIFLCNQYPQNQFMANIKSLKKLSSLITGEGLDPRRCTLDQTFVVDFLQHRIYCCPQSVKTEIGNLTSEGDFVLNQENISSFVKINLKSCEPCLSCIYKYCCGYGCIIDKLDFPSCQEKTKNELSYILSHADRFWSLTNNKHTG